MTYNYAQFEVILLPSSESPRRSWTLSLLWTRPWERRPSSASWSVLRNPWPQPGTCQLRRRWCQRTTLRKERSLCSIRSGIILIGGSARLDLKKNMGTICSNYPKRYDQFLYRSRGFRTRQGRRWPEKGKRWRKRWSTEERWDHLSSHPISNHSVEDSKLGF